MRKDQIAIGGTYLTRVSGELVRVRVQGLSARYSWGREGQHRESDGFRCVRVDNGQPLPKVRTAAALHPIPEAQDRDRYARLAVAWRTIGDQRERDNRWTAALAAYLIARDYETESANAGSCSVAAAQSLARGMVAGERYAVVEFGEDSRGDRITFYGAPSGPHSLLLDVSSEARIVAHWRGYASAEVS